MRLNAWMITIALGLATSAGAQLAPPVPNIPTPSPSPTRTLAKIVREVGLQSPSSVIHDPESDLYIVANQNGPVIKDEPTGFIGTITPEGDPVDLFWIRGRGLEAADMETSNTLELRSPKGLALRGAELLCTDIDRIMRFDRKTGEFLGAIPIPNARMLGDIAVAPDGTLFVSDTGIIRKPDGHLSDSEKYAIWKLPPTGEPTVICEDPELRQPLGMRLVDDALFVVTLKSNQVLRLDLNGKIQGAQTLASGDLGAIFRAPNGSTFVASWQDGMVFRALKGGTYQPLWQRSRNVTDIEFDATRNRMLLTLLIDNELHIRPMP